MILIANKKLYADSPAGHYCSADARVSARLQKTEIESGVQKKF